jgi:hypothetical protein
MERWLTIFVNSMIRLVSNGSPRTRISESLSEKNTSKNESFTELLAVELVNTQCEKQFYLIL